MDIETPVDTAQVQSENPPKVITQEPLPEIRRITRLDDIPKIIQPRTILPQLKKEIPSKKPVWLYRYLVIGLLIVSIIGFGLAIVAINRNDKLTKRLYKISVSLKNELTAVQYKLQHTIKLRDKLVSSRKGLVRNYLWLGPQYRILSFKMADYKEMHKKISLGRLYKINLLEGDLRVAYAKIEAVKVQNELLTEKLNERDIYIKELTSKFITNISEQELLVNENLRLKGESERLSKETMDLKESQKMSSAEAKNVNER